METALQHYMPQLLRLKTALVYLSFCWMPTPMSTFTVAFWKCPSSSSNVGKSLRCQILFMHGALAKFVRGSCGTALKIAQDRLEDLDRRAYSHDWNGHLIDYGPDGYYGPSDQLVINVLIGEAHRTVKPAQRVGDDYEPHFDFSHLPDADYRANISALQSQVAHKVGVSLVSRH